MIFLFELLFFIVLVLLFLYAPGRYLLRIARFSYSPSITLLLSFGVGIAGFLFTAYLLAWVKLEFVAFIIAGALTVLDRGRSLLELTQHRQKLSKYKIEIILLVFGMSGMCYLTSRSGIEIDGQVYFYGVNAVDSIYHLALIGNLTHSFPPEHFGLSGVPLRGYHFFYDFLLALFATYFHFQITDLYLRLFPLLVSFLFGLSFLSLSIYCKWKKGVTRGIIFSVFFLSNFEFFLNYFVQSELLAHIPEGLTQILDPSVPLSIALFICGYILFSTKKKTIDQAALTALVVGVLPMIKVYTGVLFFAGLSINLLMALYKKAIRQNIVVFVLAGIVAGIVYLPINFGVGGFIFAPFLYLRHLMEGSQFFQNLHFPIQYLVFEEHSNFLRMGIILAIICGVFFIETLGWRLPVFLISLLSWRYRRNIFRGENIFWFGVFLAGIIIPILFIQSSSVFNIVQFYWLVVTLSLPFFVLELHTLTRDYRKEVIIIVWSIFTLSSLPALVQLFNEYSTNPTSISKDVVTLSKSITRNVPQDKAVLILSERDSNNTPLLPALTARSVYLGGEGIDFPGIEKIIYSREQKIDRILEVLKSCNNSTKQKYIPRMLELISSTQTNYMLVSDTYPCLQETLHFKTITKIDGLKLIQKL